MELLLCSMSAFFRSRASTVSKHCLSLVGCPVLDQGGLSTHIPGAPPFLSSSRRFCMMYCVCFFLEGLRLSSGGQFCLSRPPCCRTFHAPAKDSMQDVASNVHAGPCLPAVCCLKTQAQRFATLRFGSASESSHTSYTRDCSFDPHLQKAPNSPSRFNFVIAVTTRRSVSGTYKR